MVTNVRELGAALHRRRVELGLSQEELCRAAGIARSWLSRVETGKHPRAEVQKVLDVALALGLTVDLAPETPGPAAGPPQRADETDPFAALFAGPS